MVSSNGVLTEEDSKSDLWLIDFVMATRENAMPQQFALVKQLIDPLVFMTNAQPSHPHVINILNIKA